MLTQDITVLALCFLSSGIFAVVGPERLFKFYIGIVLGFFLFIIANLQIKLLGIQPVATQGAFEDFLIKNKDGVIAFCVILIPLFGIFLTFNEGIMVKAKGGVTASLIFGLILPVFLLGLFTYILTCSALPLAFLADILSFFSGGVIYEFIKSHIHYVFYFLLFFIFYKVIITLLIAFGTRLFSFLSEKLGKKGGKSEAHSDGGGHEKHGGHH